MAKGEGFMKKRFHLLGISAGLARASGILVIRVFIVKMGFSSSNSFSSDSGVVSTSIFPSSPLDPPSNNSGRASELEIKIPHRR